ncbi:MAG: hypothetical protein M5U12_04440 [Verrucomicrobia bacterium]|nr:hypothetical protein [Verrucomicrobiota bacterium]
MSTLTFFRPARVSLACWWAAALFLAGGTARAEMQTQVFRLNPNWNLISFQVTPENPDAAAVFGTIPGFQSAWSYEASTGLWQRYVKPSGTAEEQADAQTANDLLRLAPIEPGRGYWVQMEGSVERWEVRGAVPSGHDFPSLRFDPGWHLIGIPVGAAVVTNREPVSLLAVLSAAGFDYDAVMTWGTNAYWKQFRPRGANHPLAGVAADPPFPAFRLQEDLGRGYWVRSLTDATLRPRLLTTLRPDMDLPPHGNFPSKEDQNVSGATNQAGLKSVRDQTVIRFFPGEEVQMVGIANQSEDERPSGGILLWEATWTPLTGTATPEPWIRLFPSRDAREERGPDGRLLGDYTRLNGVTTIESDIVYLRLDRRNLGRGRHEGILTLRTTVTNRTFQVIAEVPGVEGDFSGYAVIETVNGRRNRVPDLDLAVTFYEDASVPGLLRGLIDSSRAVMWPVDVPLVGHRITDEGNQFQLSGGYVLPPGDQNGEPFDQWDENDPAAGEDVDWLNDGKLDVRNPFPFPIQRTVLLEGALVAANPTDGQVLKGRYREVVHGLSRTPIELVGSFHLERQAVRPFTLRRSVESDTGIEPVVVARSAPPSLVIPVGESRTNRINIVTDLALHTLQVEWDFGNSTNINANLVLTLRSPGTDGRSLLLYDGRQPANAIPAEALRTVNVPLTRPPAGDFESFLRDIPRTGARPAPGLPWQLVIENRGRSPCSSPDGCCGWRASPSPKFMAAS